MNEIDFLPDQYHQKHIYRHAKPWQIMVVTSFLGLLVIVTISQNIHRRLVERELAELAPAYETALNQKQQLINAQTQLKRMEIEAELITYLRHPWPRSRLLSGLLTRLPGEITLHQLQVTREAGNTAAPTDRRPATTLEISPEQQKSIPPAQLDLQLLHSQLEGKQTVVILNGVTTDSAALHRFLDDILSNSLFTKTELGLVTSQNNSAGEEIQFNAKIFVKPGYGQSDGPAGVLNASNARNTQNISSINPTATNDSDSLRGLE